MKGSALGDPTRPRRVPPTHLLAEIEHFFEVYKMLEPQKSSSTSGYEGLDAALKEIAASKERYLKA